MLGLQYTYFSSSTLVDTITTPQLGGVELGFHQVELFGNFSQTLGGKTRLTHHLDYSFVNFQYSNWPEGLSEDERPGTLHAINYALGLEQALGKGWFIHLRAQPGIASDLQGDLGEAFVFQGEALIGKYFKEDQSLSLGLGAAYANILGEPLPLPVLDFYWQTPKITLDAHLPFRGELYYRVVPSLQLGLAGRIQGNQYALDFSDETPNSLANHIDFSLIYGGPALAWEIMPQLALQLEGGLIVNRTTEIKAKDDSLVADLDTDQFEPFFMNLKLAWKAKK